MNSPRLQSTTARRTLQTALLCGFLAAASFSATQVAHLPTAHAQSNAEFKQAYKTAQEQYDFLQLDESEKTLKNAIAKATRLNVSSPDVARLYIMLGVVQYALTRDDQKAYEQFLEGLKIDRTVRIEADYQTPSLTAVYQQAFNALPKTSNGGNGGGTTNNGGGGGPDVVGYPELKHTPPRSARARQPLEFVVEVPETVPVYRIVLNYRRYGEVEYKSVEMKPAGSTRFLARLPGKEVRSSRIDYFIEVLNRTGKILISAGGPSAPKDVLVLGEDSELPGGGEGGGEKKPKSRKYVFIQVTAGTGAGLATAPPRFNPDVELNAGLAPSPFHVVPEIGFLITPDLHLSAFYRAQIVETEHLFGGKLKWWFDNEDTLSLYTGLGAGYGRVRHTVDLAPAVDFVDTTAEGPIHGGFAFGLAYAFSESFALVGDIYTMALFPDFSVHLDASLGFRLSL